MADKTELKDFRVIASGFEHKGIRYTYPDIAHLRFVRTKTTTHMGLPIEMTKIGTDESVGLLISLKSGEGIKLSEKPGMIFSSDIENIKRIIEIYTKVSEASFASRLASYVEASEKNGYFLYSGYRFFIANKVITSDNQEFTRENTEFLQSYGYIELRPKNPSLAEKMKRSLGASKPIVVDTLTDTDIIYSILAHFYGLRWK